MTSVTITVLGSASGMPVENRAHSSYLLQIDNYSYLVDAGEGVSRSLVESKVSYNEILRVFITHTHPDHCAGLPMLLQMMMMSGRKEPIEIFLPQHAVDSFRSFLMSLYIFQNEWPFHFDLFPLLSQMHFEEGNLNVSTFPNYHLKGVSGLAKKYGVGVESNGLILAANSKRIIYTSDFVSLEDIKDHIKEADLLIIEGAHVPVEEILKSVSEKAIARILVSHLPPDFEGRNEGVEKLAMTVGISEMRLATDGMVIEI